MRLIKLASIFLMTVHLTPVSAADLRQYRWLPAELKTKIVELALRRNLISEQTILEESAKLRDGWIERVGVERARHDFFRDVITEYAKQILTPDQFVTLIERPGFQQERTALIVQLHAIETRSDELLQGWDKELGFIPPWLSGNGRKPAQLLQDRNRTGFFYLLDYYLKFEDNENSLNFTNPATVMTSVGGLVLPMAPELTWSRVLPAKLFRVGGRVRNRGQLDDLKNGFTEAMRAQRLSVSEQLKFVHLLNEFVWSPELYHDAAFAQAQVSKFGARGIALFNAFLEHFQLGASTHRLMFEICYRELTQQP
jgi:hypothetical protein